MSSSSIILVNQTASPVVLEELRVTVPASGQILLIQPPSDGPSLVHFWEIEVCSLAQKISDDLILINNGTRLLNKTESWNLVQGRFGNYTNPLVSVKAVATTDIVLSGVQVVDGVTLSAGDICLVVGQTLSAFNGLYVIAVGAWVRDAILDSSLDLLAGSVFYIEEGTNATKSFVLATVAPIVLDVTPLVFVESPPTATVVSITDSTNGEGTSPFLSRADHLHAHGDRGGGSLHVTATTSVAGFLSAADKTKLDGIASGAAALTSAAPVNVTKAAAVVGVATDAARADHKHDVTTAAALSVGTTNAEGTATSLARSDHTHAVTGFSIAGQVQGDILYFNGTAWVRLPPGAAGETLTTQGTGANPSWTGPKRYPNSATDPVSPAPAAGDTYYNTTLLMEMQYDSTRGKWLSVDSAGFQFGRNGDLTPAGTYLRNINGMVMSATLGNDALYNGTVVGISIRRSTNSASNYAVTASGADIATLAYVSGPAVRTTASNGDFAVGSVLAARLVSDAVVPEADVQMFVRIKWRV